MTDDTVVTKPDTKTAGSEYVILEMEEEGSGYWTDRIVVNGRDAEHAVRNYVKAHGDAPGTFLAIPRKSWRPLTVKAETVTTLKLEEVK